MVAAPGAEISQLVIKMPCLKLPLGRTLLVEVPKLTVGICIPIDLDDIDAGFGHYEVNPRGQW